MGGGLGRAPKSLTLFQTKPYPENASVWVIIWEGFQIPNVINCTSQEMNDNDQCIKNYTYTQTFTSEEMNKNNDKK